MNAESPFDLLLGCTMTAVKGEHPFIGQARCQVRQFEGVVQLPVQQQSAV